MSKIIPEVYANLVTEKIAGKAKVAALADKLGYLIGKREGETVTFPVWKYIGDASDIAKGTAMTSQELEQTSSTATIKTVAPKGVKVYDYDDVTQLGDAINEGAKQQGVAIARKLDSDLIAEALKSPLVYNTSNATSITAEELNSALQKFGDEQDTEDFAGIVINSLLFPSLMSMNEFTSTEKTYNTTNNGIVKNGIVGYFRGIPVIMTNKGTFDTTNSECQSFIIKKHALGYMPKEEPFVESSRDASLRLTTVYTSQMYAVKLLDESGVVVIKKTSPAQ